jgi:hypothetical protein
VYYCCNNRTDFALPLLCPVSRCPLQLLLLFRTSRPSFISSRSCMLSHLATSTYSYTLHPSICPSKSSITCTRGLGMALNSAMRVCARVQIPVCPEPPLVFSHELMAGLRTGFLVVSPLRIACVFLHVERGRSSKPVWRSPRIIYYLFCTRVLHPNGIPTFFERFSENPNGERSKLMGIPTWRNGGIGRIPML